MVLSYINNRNSVVPHLFTTAGETKLFTPAKPIVKSTDSSEVSKESRREHEDKENVVSRTTNDNVEQEDMSQGVISMKQNGCRESVISVCQSAFLSICQSSLSYLTVRIHAGV